MAHYDLQKLFDSVIKEYGINEGYRIPTISWSAENFFSRYGEYEYHTNNIIISNLLDTAKVSENAIKSVIYHEYIHQIYSDHNAAFNQKMLKFKNYEALKQQLDEYINTITEAPQAKINDLPIDEKKEILFCKFPYEPENPDSYMQHLLYLNHYTTGYLANDIPLEFCKGPLKQVVWIVEDEGHLYIVGWSKEVHLFPTKRILKSKKLYNNGESLDLQFCCPQDKARFLLPSNAIIALYKEEYPDSYIKNGIFYGTDIAPDILTDILNIINTYDSDFHIYGISDSAIPIAAPALETESVDTLLNISIIEPNSMRRLWILNKAVALEPSYRTYIERAYALDDIGIYDLSLNDYKTALSLNPKDSKTKQRIKILESVIPEIKSASLWN